MDSEAYGLLAQKSAMAAGSFIENQPESPVVA
jgi:hypothetical protein